MIDLHTHSSCSDGSDTPTQLMELAAQVGLSAIALTDHDTLEGIAAAHERAQQLGIELVVGVELSLQTEGMHLLIYDLDPHNLGSLGEEIPKLQHSRRDRNLQIIDILNSLGMEISLAEVNQVAGSGCVGRPHFASVLTQKGYVIDMTDAFERYLGSGRPANPPRYSLSPQLAISMALETGGIPVLAHPHTITAADPAADLNRLVAELASYGLVGLECLYSNYCLQERQAFLELAQKLSLVPTGGSDYHGEFRPGHDLGTGRGDLNVADSVLIELRAAAA